MALPGPQTTQEQHVPTARTHIDELDMMRVLTALAVIGVHADVSTSFVQTTMLGHDLQNLFIALLHFTRALFMFVTAFALTYVYTNRQRLQVVTYWRKRAVGVLIPYVAFTLFYQWLNWPWIYQSWDSTIHTTWYNLIAGNGAAQLYYILLTIQFYAIFPLFLWFIRATANHHRLVVIITAALQLATYSVLAYGVGTGALGDNAPVRWLSTYGERTLFTYPLFFILGGVTAWHYADIRRWLMGHGRLVGVIFLAGLGSLLAVYIGQVWWLHVPDGQTLRVSQPVMAWYSSVVIIAIGWMALRWAQQSTATGRPPGARIWRSLSDATFGVYLVHIAFLGWILQHLPVAKFGVVTFPVVWAAVAAASWGLSLVLMQTPILSRLVGRAAPLPGFLRLRGKRSPQEARSVMNHTRQAGLPAQERSCVPPASYPAPSSSSSPSPST